MQYKTAITKFMNNTIGETSAQICLRPFYSSSPAAIRPSAFDGFRFAKWPFTAASEMEKRTEITHLKFQGEILTFCCALCVSREARECASEDSIELMHSPMCVLIRIVQLAGAIAVPTEIHRYIDIIIVYFYLLWRMNSKNILLIVIIPFNHNYNYVVTQSTLNEPNCYNFIIFPKDSTSTLQRKKFVVQQ